MSSEDQGIFITTQPAAACTRCSSVKYDGRKYVDFGVDIEVAPVAPAGVVVEKDDRYTVILCSFCIAEIFKAAFPDESAPVAGWEDEKANLEQRVELLKAVNKKLEEEANALRNSNSIHVSSNSDSSNPVSSDETKPVDESTNESESGIVKPNPKSRPKNVPSLTELLEASG